MDSNEYCALVGGANGSFLVYPLDSAMCCMLYTKVFMQPSLKMEQNNSRLNEVHSKIHLSFVLFYDYFITTDKDSIRGKREGKRLGLGEFVD